MEESNKLQLLVNEFEEQRNKLKEMINEIEAIKERVSKLFPDSLDARSVRFFKEKVETFTEFYKMLLDLRKEIMKSIKDEVELRRKIGNTGDEEFDEDSLIEMLDITSLSRKVEKMKKDKFMEKASNE